MGRAGRRARRRPALLGRPEPVGGARRHAAHPVPSQDPPGPEPGVHDLPRAGRAGRRGGAAADGPVPHLPRGRGRHGRDQEGPGLREGRRDPLAACLAPAEPRLLPAPDPRGRRQGEMPDLPREGGGAGRTGRGPPALDRLQRLPPLRRTMRVTRRGFIQAVGASAGAAAVVKGQMAKADVSVGDLERWATPEEVLVPSICQQCPGGCGLLARTLDGELAGIAGNPLHPINRGALCPKAFGALQLLYDPRRLQGPLARDGARGRLRPVGWDEAMQRVVAHLSQLRAKGLAHTVAILGGQYRGYRDTVWTRFAEAWGTPNYVRVRCLAPEQPALAHQLMQGPTSPLAYDLAEARCILSFGVGLLESWLGPVHASRAFAGLRGGADRPRGQLIHVDPRRSHTAIKADRWVPIVPGTDGILALGIANGLIREGLHDREFVEQHTHGFEDWHDASGQRHQGFKDLLLGEHGLLTVSGATGVPVQTILEIARDLATLKPAVVVGERGPAYGRDDLHTRMAIHSLNALLGNIGVSGGLLDQVAHLAGFSCVSLAGPATPPRHDTRNTADVVLRLARALGGSVAESLPWERFETLLSAGGRGLWESGRGYVVSTPAEESLRRVLERQGYWVSEFKSYEEFWKALVERGAWWDPTGLPVGRKALLRTASGKFEFYSTALKSLVDEAVKREGTDTPLLSALGGRDRGDRLYLPIVPIPGRTERGDFPFLLNTYRLVTRPLGGGGNQPWLLEQPAVLVRAAWERWVEVHRETAEK